MAALGWLDQLDFAASGAPLSVAELEDRILMLTRALAAARRRNPAVQRRPVLAAVAIGGRRFDERAHERAHALVRTPALAPSE